MKSAYKWILGIILTIAVGLGIAVGLPFNDSRTLCWDWPTTNTDGTPLTDLSGARLYYSQTAGVFTDANSKDIGMATASGTISACYTVDTTFQGTWNFVVTAYNVAKIESKFSNQVQKNFVKVPRSSTNLR